MDDRAAPDQLFDQLLDRLFAEPHESFVETRARLAGELAAAGRKADAQALKKARKPSAAAWATNQVVRRARAEVDAFLGASARLRQDQTAMLAGRTDRAAYQARADELRQATAALADAARRVLGALGRDDDRHVVDRVVANARAAALTEEARAALLEARLVADLDGGAEVFGGLLAEGAAAGALPTARAPTPAAPPTERAPTARELEARRRDEERARQLEAARREETAARAVAANAAAAATRAREARDEARRRLDDADTELACAEREAAGADAGAARATRHRERFEP